MISQMNNYHTSDQRLYLNNQELKEDVQIIDLQSRHSLGKLISLYLLPPLSFPNQIYQILRCAYAPRLLQLKVSRSRLSPVTSTLLARTQLNFSAL